MNMVLEKDFMGEEVRVALFQMHLFKALGPEGFTVGLFQRHWSKVGNSVIEVYLKVLNKGEDLSTINHTYIALIPKTKKPRKVSEFRPVYATSSTK